MTIAFDTVAYICIYCADLDISMRFYRDVLALPLVRRDPDFCQFALQGTSLGLERGGWRKSSQKMPSENPVLLQFRAHSLEQLEAMNCQLEASGVKLLVRSLPLSHGVVTNFLDPDGNKLEVLYTYPL